MATIKAGRPLHDFIRLCYKADCPALILGQHGIGKSEILEQAASELGIRLICRDLSLMEPSDLIGMPKISGKHTVYLPPSFLPKQGKGLLVFEQLNRCEGYMRAACLQLLTARKLNDYCLPRGWLPVAAINPPDDNYEESEFESALFSRFAQVQVVPDRTEWLAWARRNEIHTDVIKYVASDESIFDAHQSDPLAWKSVSDVLIATDGDGAPQSSVRTAVIGLIGIRAGIAFLKWRELGRGPLTARDILEDYKQHRKLMRSWIKAGRIDLVKASHRAVEVHVRTESNYKALQDDVQSRENLGKFVDDLPGDFRETVLAHMFKLNTI